MKKKYKIVFVIFITLFIIIYLGLYLYKYNIYYKYEIKHHIHFTRENNDILRAYYLQYEHIPNKQELINFIKKTKIWKEIPIAYYLTENDFHIKVISDTIFVYENGPNFRDDKLKKRLRKKDINLFNYLFKTGDVVIFYAIKNKIKRKESHTMYNDSLFKKYIKIEEDTLKNITEYYINFNHESSQE